ncbi:MAG: 4Fe-4S dicluster domain-containing protein [Coriobacteriia bacterium]|nr:4Fe-4S dicluster domain-containing protein [Coriobacteriia bacterium]
MQYKDRPLKTEEYNRHEMAILFDASKCTGCKGCQVACKQWNQNASPVFSHEYTFTGSYESPLQNDSETFLHMTFDEYDGGPLGVEWAFGREACHHCTNAGCVMACPTGACHYVAGGFVDIDPEVCIGCHYCQTGCPFDIPKHSVRDGIERKCWMCLDRLEEGRTPACVGSCTSNALEFGDREVMVEKAQARVEFLKDRFPDAVAYGINELGGLHVIDVLPYGAEKVGLPINPSIPFWRTASEFLRPATAVGVVATVGLLAAARINSRHYFRSTDALEYDKALDETFLIGKVNQDGFEDMPTRGEGEFVEANKDEILEALREEQAQAIKANRNLASQNKREGDK